VLVLSKAQEKTGTKSAHGSLTYIIPPALQDQSERCGGLDPAREEQYQPLALVQALLIRDRFRCKDHWTFRMGSSAKLTTNGGQWV
jgi:hypothetical protein